MRTGEIFRFFGNVNLLEPVYRYKMANVSSNQS